MPPVAWQLWQSISCATGTTASSEASFAPVILEKAVIRNKGYGLVCPASSRRVKGMPSATNQACAASNVIS
jgi:hypothetical protein